MELSSIPEIGPVNAGILAEGGVRTAAELAAHADIEALAQRTRMAPGRLEAFRAAVWSHLEAILEGAGVRDLDQLADADVSALAASTGLAPDSLALFQSAARQKLGRSPSGAPLAEAQAAARPDRVILSDGRATARVSLGGILHAGLAIVTLRMEEDEADVLARAPGDAVLLKERAVTAPARVGGVLHRDLPIYKEQARDGGATDEIRVRVAEIKDRRRAASAPPAPLPLPAAATDPGTAAPAEAPRKKGFSLFRRGK